MAAQSPLMARSGALRRSTFNWRGILDAAARAAAFRPKKRTANGRESTLDEVLAERVVWMLSSVSSSRAR
jgi:uncharacterized protein with von Willebrand factor type A (vWA) domain